MKYYFGYKIYGYYDGEIDIDSTDKDAIVQAVREKYYGADFGVLDEIDGDINYIEDEKGNVIFND